MSFHNLLSFLFVSPTAEQKGSGMFYKKNASHGFKLEFKLTLDTAKQTIIITIGTNVRNSPIVKKKVFVKQ